MREIRDLQYSPGHPRRQLDLYLPDTPNPPLLVFAHGGAWRSGDRSECTSLGHTFAQCGVAVAIPTYRLSTEAGIRHPAPVHDMALALAYLADHGRNSAYNRSNVFFAGHSAGAHMGGMLVTDRQFLEPIRPEYRPRGYIGIEGIFDLPSLDKTWPTYREWFIEAAFGSDQLWRSASPALRPVVVTAPWLLIHAEGDELVDAAQSANFADNLRRYHVRCRQFDPGEKSHFGVIEGLADRFDPTVRAILEFIEEGIR